MTTELNGNSTGQDLAIREEPVQVRHLNGGVQALFRFPNGFGASVVRSSYTYGGTAGLWELAVLKWEGKDFLLTYDTSVTEDVIGHLHPGEVDELLLRIKSLDEKGREPQPEALASEQVRTLLAAWVARGLPSGEVAFSSHHPLAYLKMAAPSDVAVWAVALGQQITFDGGSVVATKCRPVDLPGWELEVYCDEPVVKPEQRIAVRAES